MKYSCDLIRDLLPLYIDDVASPSSRRMVEEHLAECADCRVILDQMKNEEVEKAITDEKEDVIAGQRRFFQRKSAIAGSIVAGIFMIALAVCLIVNLASGSGPGWFIVVLASLLVAASVSIVPLMVPESKGLWTLGAFTASLLLLFGVCCLYSGGKWFFVAGTSVLFGLSVIALPFVVRSKVLPEFLKNHAGFAVMAADTVLYALMMLAIGLYAKAPRFFPVTAAISVPILLLAWAAFIVIRRVRQNGTKQDFLVPAENPYTWPVRRKENPKRPMRVWQILLLAMGSPLWFPLLISAAAVLLSVYLVIWAVILSLWAAEAAMIVGACGGVVMGLLAIFRGTGLQGIILICMAFVLAGLSIFLFFGCMAATGGTAALTKKIALWIQSMFIGKENGK